TTDTNNREQTQPRGWPVCKYGRKKKPKQHKNTVVAYSERVTIINFYESYGMPATLDAFYDHLTSNTGETARKKVYSWVANRIHIQMMGSSPTTAKLRCWRTLGMRTTHTRQDEEQLLRWVLDMRKHGVPVTHSMLRIMALEAAIDLVLEDHEFLAGLHWVDGFKRRHGLSLRAHTPSFAQRVQTMMRENNIDYCVYNADQTGVNYEYLPTKTLNPTGDITIWVKCGGKANERVTAMFLTDSTGEKYPLFLALRSTKSKVNSIVQESLTERQDFGKAVWKSVVPIQDQSDCQIYGNPTAWWNAKISMEFLK
ncbi:hypothetical protein AaE_010557, partial [Aphanomyces astaci]